MLGKTSRTIGALAAMGLVVAGIVATSLPASGQTVPEATQPVFAPYGTLTINLTDRVGNYKLDLADPAAVDPPLEEIKVGNTCANILRGSGQLLNFIPNPLSPSTLADTVQIRDSAVGVNTGNTSCGSSAAAVISGSEQLRIALGPQLNGVYIESANLQIAQLRTGSLQVRLDDETAAFSETSFTTSPAPVLVAPQINTVDNLFTSITLQTKNARRDGEGLSVFNGTSFKLVKLDPKFEVAVNCGEQVSQVGLTGQIADNAVFFRGANAIKVSNQPQCSDVGASVVIRDGFVGSTYPEGAVFWDNSRIGVNGSVQAVRATITIDWAPVADPAKLNRQIDYDGDGPGGFAATLWCESFASPTNGVLPKYPGLTGTAATNQSVRPDPAIYPGAVFVDNFWRVPWCLVSDTRVLQGSDIKQTEVLFGSGDPLRK